MSTQTNKQDNKTHTQMKKHMFTQQVFHKNPEMESILYKHITIMQKTTAKTNFKNIP